MLVNREAAIRVLQNAVLFSDVKSEAAGLISVEDGTDGLVFTASDDFVIIRDSVLYDGQVPEPFFLDQKMAKEVIKTAQASNSEQLDLTLLPPAEAEWSEEFQTGISAMLSERFFQPWVGESSPVAFAVRPSRFAKFSRLKLSDDYPVDFTYGVVWVTSHFSRDVLKFKAGPTVHGVLAPILRTTLAEEFKNEPEVIW